MPHARRRIDHGVDESGAIGRTLPSSARHFNDIWVFLAGPTVGALLALAVTVAIRPHRNQDEHEAAQGEGEDATVSEA